MTTNLKTSPDAADFNFSYLFPCFSLLAKPESSQLGYARLISPILSRIFRARQKRSNTKTKHTMINAEKLNSSVQLVELRDEEMAAVSGGLVEALLAALIIEGIMLDIELVTEAVEEYKDLIETCPECGPCVPDEYNSTMAGM